MKIGTKTHLVYTNHFVSKALYNVAINATNKMLELNSPAQLREQILLFHQKYGTKATIDAYKLSRATIYRWRKVYIESRKDISILIPKSRSPINKRTMYVDYRIMDFIKELRTRRGRIGKEKVKPLLDEYSATNNIAKLSISKIGRIIRKYNLTYSPQRLYHNGRPKPYNRYKEKIKKAPRPEQFGYVEVDTITKLKDGIKTYIFNSIDVKSKFQFSYAYKSSNSINATDFMKKLQQVYPIENGIKIVQTDNGSEYLGEFHEYLKKQKLKHVFIYPRCPKINGCVERANRTLREDFIDRREYLISNGLEVFNRELMEHLIWYNTKRVHKSLKNQTPIDYLLKVLPESHMYWTHTIT
jgi:putative transposase